MKKTRNGERQRERERERGGVQEESDDHVGPEEDVRLLACVCKREGDSERERRESESERKNDREGEKKRWGGTRRKR